MPDRQYRPDIDGLRAVAVMAVLLFHAGLGCPGGYVGVDVFFVISGFLITRLILQEVQDGRFSLARFWERRIRRIFPILFVVIGVTLVLAWTYVWPYEFAAIANSALWMSVMASNFYFWGDTGYFGGPAEFKPLLHTWSLSVEEQFYLLYPLFLMIAVKWFSSKSLPMLLGIVFVASLSISIAGVFLAASATFYLLPTRAWELMAGGLLVVGANSRFRPRQNEVVAVVGLAMILVSIFLFDRNTRFPGAAALLPVGGTAAIIYANTNHATTIGRVLSCRPLVFTGLISYSLYLWHWPLLIFGQIRFWEVPNIKLLVLVFCYVLSIITWRWVETPFRRAPGRTVPVGSVPMSVPPPSRLPRFPLVCSSFLAVGCLNAILSS